MGKNELAAWINEGDRWYDVLTDLLPGGIGIYEVDKNGNITSIFGNEDIMQLISNYSVDEIEELGTHIDKLVYKEDVPLLYEALKKAVREKSRLDVDVRYHRSPNSLGWLWVRGKIIRKTDNKAVFSALLIDISRMKSLEANLSIQQERYRILEETSSEILFELRPKEDKMTYSLKELDGTFSRKVVENYMASLQESPMVHPDSIGEFKELLSQAMKTPKKGKLEYLSSISGRGYEWHYLNYASVADDSGEVISIFGRIKNIHDKVVKRQLMYKESGIDEMTNMYRSDYLVDKIQRRMEKVPLDCRHILMLVEIKNFTKIVEQSGHAGGDAVIQKISKVLNEVFPERTLFGRKGNQKYMIYLEDEEDTKIDEMVKEFFAMLLLPENRVLDMLIECSVGAVMIQGMVDYSRLYEEADDALYLAKITKGTDYVRVP